MLRALVNRESSLVLDMNYPQPEPNEGEALIRVLMAGFCNTDLEIVRGYLGFHRVLGHEFVGIVEAVREGSGASPLTSLIGKRVVGEINAACYRQDCSYCQGGMPTHCPNRSTLGIVNRDGAFADYLVLPTRNLHLVSDTVSDEEAVFTEPLAATFEILEQVHLKPTECVAILGDGKMGQLSAQVLKLVGCEVMMVDKHEEKLALAAQNGMQTYLLEDAQRFTLANERRVDMMVECTGSAQGLELALRLVQARGVIVLKSTVAKETLLHPAPIVIDEIRIQGSRCGPFAPALRALSQKLVDVLSLVSSEYPLDEWLAAFQYAAQNGVLKVLVRI